MDKQSLIPIITEEDQKKLMEYIAKKIFSVGGTIITIGVTVGGILSLSALIALKILEYKSSSPTPNILTIFIPFFHQFVQIRFNFNYIERFFMELLEREEFGTLLDRLNEIRDMTIVLIPKLQALQTLCTPQELEIIHNYLSDNE